MSDVAVGADPDEGPPAGASRAPRARGHRLARRLPGWMGSIRFRLTALYSGLLFLVAWLAIGLPWLLLIQ